MTDKTNIYSPFVYWAQTDTQITLKVDLKEVKDPKIILKTKEINFSAHGYGARGLNEYNFSLNFYSDIDVDGSSYKVIDSKVDFILKKLTTNWWPRVIAQPQKPHWLKIDFDRWRSEEEIQTDDEEQRDIMADYPGMYDKLHKEEYGYRKEQNKKVYLIFYNLSQFIGYLYILIVIGIRYYRDGYDSIGGTYDAVGNAIKFCQLIKYLETMHPLFGYTKGGALMPFAQTTGQNFILFIMIDYEKRMQIKPVIFYLFIIWSSIEIVRYPYYITTLLNKTINLITWLRYSLWIPLYPLGILCEGIVILRNIPYFEETQRFTVILPNKYNFTFDMTIFMKIYLLLLILPITYYVMTHMAKMREKKLSGFNNRKSL